jgi:hypothetical protein
MQQISAQNTRSSARPMIWLTLAFHLALGAYLYHKTTSDDPAPKKEAVEMVEKP